MERVGERGREGAGAGDSQRAWEEGQSGGLHLECCCELIVCQGTTADY